jgi:hypothetical protein
MLIGMLIGVLVLKYKYKFEYKSVSIQKTVVEKTFENYGEQAIKAGEEYNIPPEYLLSLIVLESSGRKLIPQRFEPHVYRKLDAVARSKQPRLETVTPEDLRGLTDGELKQLASSWGPFQIMGYKSFEIDVDVEDLQGRRSVITGAKWIDKNYGKQLRNNQLKDAFHIHNTGKPYPLVGPPKTYHKDYVPKGLRYAEEFRALLAAM